MAKNQGFSIDHSQYEQAEFIPFAAETRMSGMDINGVSYRKGAVDAIQKYVQQLGGEIPSDLKEKVIKSQVKEERR